MRIRLTLSLALLLASIAHCDVGGTGMGTSRAKQQAGTGGYAKQKDAQNRVGGRVQPSIEIDRTKSGDAKRARCQRDILYLYDNFVASLRKDSKTKALIKENLDGKLHRLMLDYKLLDIIDEVQPCSELVSYLPEKDANGEYPETWLYWKTLDAPPEIQDGPDGPISKRFYGSFWQGVTIRICGDGKTKCMLCPRHHLKSTIGRLNTLFRMLRAPEERHVIRTNCTDLAKEFLDGIKNPFENNDDFRFLFGDLKPEPHKGEWNTETIRLKFDAKLKRGTDPTVKVAGNASDKTGTHWDYGGCDDVVSEKNSKSPKMLLDTNKLVSAMQGQRGVGGNLDNDGTRWDENDAHQQFIGKPGANEWSGTLSENCCFFVATVLDGDESASVSPIANGQIVTQSGYGKPIWPEGFGLRAIRAMRTAMPQDWLWFGQFFNQFFGTTNRLFDESWITDYEERYERLGPALTAKELRLNIFVAFDTAKGGTIQTGKLDNTAGFVLGQTPDRKRVFFLGGFCEKLPAQFIAKGICDLCVQWKTIAGEYGGIFKAGFEKTAFTDSIKKLLMEEQAKRGDEATFAIDEIEHGNRAKCARIEILVQPYSERRVYWPLMLVVPAVDPNRQPYDLREILKLEFLGYHPKATRDDLVDAHAYAWEMALPSHWKNAVEKLARVLSPGEFARQATEAEDMAPSLGGYEGFQL